MNAMDGSEQDYHNFSTPSSRIAIRKARQSLQPISTSLPLLDATLGKASSFNTSTTGGLQRGVVTEVFGPPGVGKTTFALQVAVNALRTSSYPISITWIDTASQLVPSRLLQLLSAHETPQDSELPSSPPLPQGTNSAVLAERFNYLQIPSLTRLLALFLSPANSSFPPPNTGVIVLDDLSSLVLSSLPRSGRSTSIRTPQKTPSSIQDAAAAKRILTRRFQVLSSFALSLQKFAAANNVAILVTSKATVNLKAGQKAVLRPALTSEQWDKYLSVRVALFRDFWPAEIPTTQNDEPGEAKGPTDFERKSLRFAKVIKLGGKLVSSREVGFVIEKGGLREVIADTAENDASVLPLATQPLRPLEDVSDSGINDSDNIASNAEVTDDELDQTVVNLPVPEVSGQTKRKAIEIADSDDDSDNGSDSDKEPTAAPNASQDKGFRPSSQVYQAALDADRHDVSSEAKKIQADNTSSLTSKRDAQSDHSRDKANEVVMEDEEMLLESYEKDVPPFSQAAIEMSDPLTPSDDGRDLS